MWIDGMVTVEKEAGSSVGVHTATAPNHRFSWLDTREQPVMVSGKARLFEKESAATKALRGMGAAGAYSRGSSGGSFAPGHSVSRGFAGQQAAQQYNVKNQPKLLDIRAKELVVTDSRIILVDKDGSKAFEFVRDIDFAKRYFDYLRYIENARMEAYNNQSTGTKYVNLYIKHKAGNEHIVGGNGVVVFFNSAEKSRTGLASMS